MHHMIMELSKFIDAEGLSGWLCVPKPTIYSWKRRGKIPYVQLGRCIRFEVQEIGEWIQERRNPPRNGIQVEYIKPSIQKALSLGG
jgi:excisionase family DNA binding protein